MKVYPDAKIILSTRNPDTWYESVFNSIHQVEMLIKANWMARTFLKLIDRRRPSPFDMMETMRATPPDGCDVSFHDAIEKGPEVSKKFFLDWEAEVRRVVPQ